METGERAGAPFQGQRILPAELLKTQRKAQENARQEVYLTGGAISLLEALVGVQIRTCTPSNERYGSSSSLRQLPGTSHP
jgi:hypothetical protein